MEIGSARLWTDAGLLLPMAIEMSMDRLRKQGGA